MSVLHNWIKSYENRDLQLIKSIMSPSENHISWGTGKDERYVGISDFLQKVQRDFTQSEGAKLNLLSKYVVMHENSAWIVAELEPIIILKGEPHKLEILRGTFVLVKDKGEWLIEHMHGSWPYPLQTEGQSFPSTQQ